MRSRSPRVPSMQPSVPQRRSLMATHEYYEQLCTLAAAGQLSSDEWTELRQHLKSCPDCDALIYDCGQIGFQILPLVADDYKAIPPPPGLVKRVIARASSEAMPLKVQESRRAPIKHHTRTMASRIALGGFTISLV